MRDKLIEITRKHLEGRTLEKFAASLGIPSSKQQVWMWKSGKQAPDTLTLFRVIASPTAEAWARAWAGECLSVIQSDRESKDTPEPDPLTA
ncbi:MAG TPA: hypothetical protein VLH56_10980 [Dissulfurispiraceae bacterium]|nr:hypothetical protein [Dissulfurispiraceae bacterium]